MSIYQLYSFHNFSLFFLQYYQCDPQAFDGMLLFDVYAYVAMRRKDGRPQANHFLIACKIS